MKSATGRSDHAVRIRDQEIEHAAIGEVESQFRPSPVELRQVQMIHRCDVALNFQRGPRGLIICFREVLVHRQMVSDASQAGGSFKDVAFVCRLLN
jgi:hypothetical protein